ncbi:hypothetical protein GCM10028775_21420 [Catellatospora paridis]
MTSPHVTDLYPPTTRVGEIMAQSGTQAAKRVPPMRRTPRSAIQCAGNAGRGLDPHTIRREALAPPAKAECWAEFWTVVAKAHAAAHRRERLARAGGRRT